MLPSFVIDVPFFKAWRNCISIPLSFCVGVFTNGQTG